MGKMKSFSQPDTFMGDKPFSTIGPDRDSMTASKNIITKLKKKKSNGKDGQGGVASHSSGQDGEMANADGISKTINKMMDLKYAKK